MAAAAGVPCLLLALLASGTAYAQAAPASGAEPAAGSAAGPATASAAAVATSSSDQPWAPLRFYGVARLDGIWSNSQMQDVELPMWALSEPVSGEARDDAELSLHPWLTRVGVSLDELQLPEGVVASARIEVDFLQERTAYGPQLRFRHADAQLAVGHWSVMLGHTDDLVSPLYPSVNDASRMWNAGNLGDRRAQFRARFAPNIGAGRLIFAAAAGMPSAVDKQDLDRDGELDGYAAAVPVAQGLIELAGNYWTRKRPFRVGASGHVAVEEVGDVSDDNPPAGAFDYDGARRLHAFSIAGHLQLPILDSVWLKGEGFYGQNLPDVRGGIGESISLTTGQEVRAFGGWAELGVEPAPWFTGIIGGSVDHPLDGVVADGQRSRNLTVFAANRFRLFEAWTVALEYGYWVTSYQNRGEGSAQRLNLWSSYDF